jgi:hypothetical protein
MTSSNPVILKLEGGLGNQLFQLAAGYFLAAKLNSDLWIDQYSIPLTTAHGETGIGFEPFETPSLPNQMEIRLLPEVPSRVVTSLAKRSRWSKRIVLKIRILKSNPNKLKLFVETNDLKSTREFFKVDMSMKLHGNFQSWTIVEKAAQLGFPRVFRLRNTPKWIKEFEKEIDFKESVALHFRVGDDTRTNSNFSQPEIAYYLEALKIVKSKKNVSDIYILSDEIPRVKELFGDLFDNNVHYLEMPSESSPAERLYVLSLFGGIICANSTFCGWAAWSIHNSGGGIIVPVPYSDGPIPGSRDFPSSWIQLNKFTGACMD